MINFKSDTKSMVSPDSMRCKIGFTFCSPGVGTYLPRSFGWCELGSGTLNLRISASSCTAYFCRRSSSPVLRLVPICVEGVAYNLFGESNRFPVAFTAVSGLFFGDLAEPRLELGCFFAAITSSYSASRLFFYFISTAIWASLLQLAIFYTSSLLSLVNSISRSLSLKISSFPGPVLAEASLFDPLEPAPDPRRTGFLMEDMFSAAEKEVSASSTGSPKVGIFSSSSLVGLTLRFGLLF